MLSNLIPNIDSTIIFTAYIGLPYKGVVEINNTLDDLIGPCYQSTYCAWQKYSEGA